MTNHYTNLLIRVSAYDNGQKAYPVKAYLDNGGIFSGGWMYVDWDSLQAVTLEPEYGYQLFEALFTGPIRRAYDKATGRAEIKSGGRLRLRLSIDDKAAELHTICWEKIQHYQQGKLVPLTTSSLHPFSRYIELEMAEPKPLYARPLKLLIAIANPTNLEQDYGLIPININTELDNLCEALTEAEQSGSKLQVTLMPGRSRLSIRLQEKFIKAGYHILSGYTSLSNILHHLPSYHIFHFIGHGAFNKKTAQSGNQTALYLEDKDDGSCQITKDYELIAPLIGSHPLPHLIFLNACETAKQSDETIRPHPFVGLAPKLVQAGIPAVIAMQEQIPVQIARQLARDFYHNLQQFGVIDTALNHARNLLDRQDNLDWSIPVLFMRLKTGRLLVPDPIRGALEAVKHNPIYDFFSPQNGKYLSLPIDVIHLSGQQTMSNLSQLEVEPTARIDLLKATFNLFSDWDYSHTARRIPKLVILVGEHGSNKSTQLKCIVWHTAQNSLAPQTIRKILPVYVDLRRYPDIRSTRSNPIEALILESLRPFWPTLNDKTLAEILTGDEITLRIMFDGNDDLPVREHRPAWSQILKFMQAYPYHQYMLALRPTSLYSEHHQETELHLLVIQPLAQHKIRSFLEQEWQEQQNRNSYILLKKLDRSQLYDLAAIPWFMVKMIQHARTGDYPESRTQVLQQLVENAIANIPADIGVMRQHAEEILCLLAWQMQSSRCIVWPVSKIFQAMKEIRGYRGYRLEELYEALIQSGLIAGVGEDNLRFTYLPIQAYCCAKAIVHKPNYNQLLDDITATFGRPTRLRWWEDCFVFLSGLMSNNLGSLKNLLQKIVYGVDLLQSGQTLLTARCLLEIKRHNIELEEIGIQAATTGTGRQGRRNIRKHNLNRLRSIYRQVTDALIWRLNSTRERNLSNRIKAAELLGQLASPVVIPHLSEVVKTKVRRDLGNRRDYDFSSIRLAAAMALQYIITRVEQDLEIVDPLLIDLLHTWQPENIWGIISRLQKDGKDVELTIGLINEFSSLEMWLLEVWNYWKEADISALTKLLQGDDISPSGIAALALGDIYVRLENTHVSQTHLDDILKSLTDSFFNPETDESTLWSVTHALAMLDSNMVTYTIILPSIRLDSASSRKINKSSIRRYKCLAHLIGLIRCQELEAHNFLVEYCLKKFNSIGLLASAIEALGYMADKKYQDLLETIASGQFETVMPRATKFTEEKQHYLQRRAIESLALVGDINTLDRLRSSDIDWTAELRQAFYRTSEEIYWRLKP